MKNKITIILILIQIIFCNNLYSEEFKLESQEIQILEKGNIINATGGVNVSSEDGTEIKAKEVLYNKSDSILKASGKVVLIDKKKNITILADEIVYNKKKEIISSIKKNNQVAVNDNKNNVIISADKIIYNKNIDIINFIKVTQQVNVNDKKNKVIISADAIIYDSNIQKISSIKKNEQVNVNDKKNKVIILADKIDYDMAKNMISSKGNILTNIENKYQIMSEELIHDRILMEFNSSKKTIFKDNSGNIIELDAFDFNMDEKLLKATNIILFDKQNNKYSMENSIVNLDTNEIIGSDIGIDFDNSLFGNNKNEPRLKGKSIVADDKQTTIYKGVFTTCKKTEKKCPPWSIYADEVKHKKKEKIIEYKNAWLEIYNKPVLYFPYFFHPDPTVKRQSGFLMPKFASSNNSGQSIHIPYYKVLSDNKDLTISPRIFFDNNIILQTEYREVNKNYNFHSDLSINSNNNTTNSHVFAKIKGNHNDLLYKINLQSVSNDNYLKEHKLDSPLITNFSSLNSSITIEKIEKDQAFFSSFEVYEDLTKQDSDRYEFIYPKYKYEKNYNNNNWNGNLDFISKGFQKKYETNISEIVIINDLKYTSNSKISLNGFNNSFDILLRNINSDANNSSKYKNKDNNNLLSTFVFESKLPLKKSSKKYNNFLTPIFSYRYSPNETKNYYGLDSRLNYNNIFTLDRINKDDMVEGGHSITVGAEYSKKSKDDADIFKLGLASNLRNEQNYDLPRQSSLGNKTSDIVGYANFIPSNFFNLEYEFSLDNNLDELNYNFIKTNFTISSFKTSFEFLEEDNFIGDKSYVKNISKIDLNNNNAIAFETNRNLDKDITEYYNLIYEYKNDCLIAAVEYNKDFYKDDGLEPSENIFFTIKIVPFGSISTPSISK
tara:strand:+ start:2171 stop:4843 length:2673 start_codon:yes stop_codon:yes gene_type:complete